MRNLYLFVSLLFITLSSTFAQSDSNLLVETNASGSIALCGDEVTFTITMSNTSSGIISGITYESDLAIGVTVINSQYTNDGTVGTPKFTIPDIPANSVVNFTYTVKGDCAVLEEFNSAIDNALDYNVANDNTISYSLNGTPQSLSGISESYNIRFAELEAKVADADVNLFTGVIEKDADATIFNRQIEVRNSGLGALSEYTFYVDVDNRLTFTELSLGTIVLTPVSTGISPNRPDFNRLTYTINDFSSIGNGNALFEQNEIMLFTDKVSLSLCESALETSYTVNWGCNAIACNETDQEATSIAYVSFVDGRPTVATSPIVTDPGSYCGNQGIYEFSLKNIGSGSSVPQADTAFNLRLNDYAPFASSYSINSMFLTDENGTNTYFDTDFGNFFTTDPDGSGIGLEDVDKDGFYDDLPVGNTLTLKTTYDITWDPVVFDRLYVLIANIQIFYNDNDCVPNSYSRGIGSIGQHSFVSAEPVAVIPEEISASNPDTEIFKFNVSRNAIRNNLVGALIFGDFYSEFRLPEGYSIEGARWSEDLSTPLVYNKEGDIYRVFGGSNRGYYELDVRVNCPGTPASEIADVEWNMYVDACVGTSTLEPIPFASDSKPIFTDYSSCSGGGPGGGGCDFTTTSFNMDRNTFGYEDPAPDPNNGNQEYITNDQLATAPRVMSTSAGINIDAAYPLDKVLINAEGALLANTNVENYDQIYFEFAYNKTIGTSDIGLLKNSNGIIDIGTNSYPLGVPVISFSGDRVTYKYTIDVNISNATEIPISVSDMEMQFLSKTESGLTRGVYKLSVLRAKFYGRKAVTNDIGCSFSQGTNFSFLMPELFIGFQNSTIHFVRNEYGWTRIRYASGADDFPNEYRPMVIYDKLTIYPPDNYQIKEGYPFTSRSTSANITTFYDHQVITLNDDLSTPGIEFSFENHIAPDAIRSFNYTYNYLRLRFDPICDANYQIPPNGTNKAPFTQLTYIDPFDGPNPKTSIDNFGRTYLDLSFSVSPNTVQEGFERSVSWPVLFCNEESSFLFNNQKNTWVALELKPGDNRTVLQGAYTIDQNGDEIDLPKIFYGQGATGGVARGMFIKTGDLLAENCFTVYPRVTYTDCENDVSQNIDIISSWDYDGYPLDNLTQTELEQLTTIKEGDLLSCQYRQIDQELTLRYKTGDLTWEVNRLEDQVDLCEAMSYEVKVVSSKFANVYDTDLTINLPRGITFEDINDIQYVYDGVQGTVDPTFIDVLNTSSPKVKVSELVTNLLVAANTAGIDSSDNTIPGTRLVGKNEILFTMNFVADCTMDPGIPIQFNLNGVTNCQDNINLIFNRLFPINGVVLPDLAVDVQASDFLVCNTQNEVTINLVNTTTATDVAQQQLTLTLPNGVSYGSTVSGFEAPVQSGNTLTWDINDINTDRNQTFKIYTNLTDLSLTEFVYEVSSVQNGQAVCVDDQLACDLNVTTAQDSDTAAQITLPTVTITPITNLPACEGEQVVVSVELAGVTDYSNYTFDWNVNPISSNSNQFTFNLLNSTQLSVTVSPNGNNNGSCSGSASIDVDIYPGATINMTLVEGVTCAGESDGKATVTITGESNTGFVAQEPFEIIGSTPAGVVLIGQMVNNGDLINVGNLPQGSFTINFKDAYGCTFERTLNIPLINNPISNFCTSLLACGVSAGDVTMSFDMADIHSNLSGTAYTARVVDTQVGTDILSFSGTFPDNQSHTLTNVATSTGYLLEVTADNGCVYSRPFMIDRYTVSASITNNPVYELCFANETRDIVVGISDNIPPCSTFAVPEYEVLFGIRDINDEYIGSPQVFTGVTNEITFDGLGVGNYKVVVKPAGVTGYQDDIAECEEVITFDITSRANFTATLETIDPLCAGEANGSAQVILNGGSGTFTYEWTQEGSSEILSSSYQVMGLAAGNYEVVITDTNGCPNAVPLTFTLTDPDPMEVPFIEDVQTACEAIAGSGNGVTASGYTSGTAPYTFDWYEILTFTNDDGSIATAETFVYQEQVPDGGTSTFAGITPGDYKVIVTDTNGCKAESLITAVTQPDVSRQYNISLGWSSPIVEENEATPPATTENAPIAASNFRAAITSQVERCVAEAQSVLTESVTGALKNIDLLNDTLELAYVNGDTDVYHFTLYYYDRAGNLVRTVPPSGVVIASDSNGDITRTPTNHTYVTGYDYNSIAQLEKQNTPDGGTTNFLYNDIGQLLYSQNERQITDGAFSYSIYDELGRIIEAGEADLNGKIFPDDFLVNNQADPTVAQGLPLSDKGEYISTTFNNRAAITYQGEEQRYLRNRVSNIYGLDKNGSTSNTYYSYDPHGNVEWIVQELPGIGQTTVAYEYDLISGNVNEVIFNKGRVDEYHHQYTYDADNRIESVKTSKDGYLWDEDARYDYYLHGPLARTEIGEDNIQGLDFTYTIHGWLKGINTPDLKQNAYNPDEVNVQGVAGNKHAKDEFGMALGYYGGDFTRDGVFDTRLTASNPFVLENQVNGVSQNLYNGNISTWTSQTAAEAKEKNLTSYLTGNAYQYDQLNRIKEATTKAFDEVSQGYTSINGQADAFRTNYSYDGNGNLQTLKRYKDDGQLMDDLSYHYDLTSPNLSNQLTHVTDPLGQVSAEINDLPNQSSGNYVYDAIGQLTRDNSEELTYVWNTSGKVSEIIPDDTGNTATQKVHMKFTYDGLGNRIVKQVNRMPYDASGNGSQINNPEAMEITYYSRDAQGNVMGIYKREDVKVSPGNASDLTYRATFKMIERPIYGSDRVGQDTHEEEIYNALYTFTGEADYNAVMLQFIETINSYAFGNVLVAQNNDQEIFDVNGNTITVSGTNLAVANVDGEFIDLQYNSTLVQDGNSTPIQTNNNIFIIEDRDENALGYGVVASNYYSAAAEDGVMLIYDTNGNIIPGLQLINADTAEHIDALAKSVVVNNPALANEYFLFYRDVTGGMHTATLSTASGSLEVTALEDRQFSNYGRHLALVQDHKNKKAYVYGTTHTGAVLDANGDVTTPPQANLIRFTIEDTGTIIADGTVTDVFDAYDTNGNGELQIALDGGSMSLYNNTTLATQWTGLAEAEIRSWQIDEDNWMPVESSLQTLVVGGNIGKGSLLNTGTELYYTQRSQEISTGTETKVVKRASDGQVLVDDLGDLRANKNNKFYRFAQGTNTGQEWNFLATTTVALNNLPASVNGSTGYQPYQPYTINGVTPPTANGIVFRNVGEKQYELKDHLGNVRVVVSDRKDLNTTDNSLTAHIESYNNYYPFGMQQPGRNFNSPNYRYGFNGKEKDSELKGEGTQYDYGFRIYDARLSKFLSVDPLSGSYPWYTPYQFAGNKPIKFIDLDGLEEADNVQIQAAKKAHREIKLTQSPHFVNITPKTINDQVLSRINSLGKNVNQGKFYLCGPAAAVHIATSHDPETYVRTVFDLYLNGSANGGDITGSKAIYKSKVKNGKIDGIDAVDWILMHSLRKSENAINWSEYDPHVKDDISKMTLKSEFSDLIERLGANVSFAKSNSSISSKDDLSSISDWVSSKKRAVLFINSRAYRGQSNGTGVEGWVSGNYGRHFIVLKSIFETKKGGVVIKYWDYGKNKLTTHRFKSFKEFKNSTFDYWLVENEGQESSDEEQNDNR